MQISSFLLFEFKSFLFPDVVWFAFFVESGETLKSVFCTNDLLIAVFFDGISSGQIDL